VVARRDPQADALERAAGAAFEGDRDVVEHDVRRARRHRCGASGGFLRRRIQHLGQPFSSADRGHAVVVIGGKRPQRLEEIRRHQQHEQAAEQRQPRRGAPADMPEQPEADIGGDDRDRDRGEEFQAG
jgi:hypothetical protein